MKMMSRAAGRWVRFAIFGVKPPRHEERQDPEWVRFAKTGVVSRDEPKVAKLGRPHVTYLTIHTFNASSFHPWLNFSHKTFF
jgi:hypothetical protein